MLRDSAPDEPLLARDVRQLMHKYSLAPEMLEEIIAGVEMDLSILRYATFEELARLLLPRRQRSWPGQHRDFRLSKSALPRIRDRSRARLADDEHHSRCRKGFAGNGRIYLPQEDLARFDYSEAELAKRQYNEHFLQLMQFEAARAREFFARAAAALPPEDRRSMAPAEIMGSIYRALLRRIELDKFRVFEKEYRLEQAGESRPDHGAVVQIFFEFAAPSIRLSSWLRNITKDKPMKMKSLKILSAITIALVVLGTTLYAQGTDTRIGSMRTNAVEMATAATADHQGRR